MLSTTMSLSTDRWPNHTATTEYMFGCVRVFVCIIGHFGGGGPIRTQMTSLRFSEIKRSFGTNNQYVSPKAGVRN